MLSRSLKQFLMHAKQPKHRSQILNRESNIIQNKAINWAFDPSEVAQKIRQGSEVALFQTASSATLFTGQGKGRFSLDQYMMFIILFDCLLAVAWNQNFPSALKNLVWRYSFPMKGRPTQDQLNQHLSLNGLVFWQRNYIVPYADFYA